MHNSHFAGEISRVDMIANNANSYLNMLREQRQSSEEVLRPTTSDFTSPNSNNNTEVNAY